MFLYFQEVKVFQQRKWTLATSIRGTGRLSPTPLRVLLWTVVGLLLNMLPSMCQHQRTLRPPKPHHHQTYLQVVPCRPHDQYTHTHTVALAKKPNVKNQKMCNIIRWRRQTHSPRAMIQSHFLILSTVVCVCSPPFFFFLCVKWTSELKAPCGLLLCVWQASVSTPQLRLSLNERSTRSSVEDFLQSALSVCRGHMQE